MTTPEVSSIRDADRIIGLLEAAQIKKTEMLINRIRPALVARGEMMSVEDVTEILAIPLIGVLTDQEDIVIASNQGEPLAGKDSPGRSAFLNIARRLGRNSSISGSESGRYTVSETAGSYLRKIPDKKTRDEL